MKRLLRTILIMLIVYAIAATAGADTITLRHSAHVAPNQPVRLADVATLVGADVEALGDVVVVANPRQRAGERGWFECTVDALRDALADEAMNWGRVTLRGRACTVRLSGAAEDESADSDAPSQPMKKTNGPTIRDAAIDAIARTLGVALDDLRLTFAARDQAFLDRSAWGVRIETQPVTSGSSARQGVAIRLYEGETLLDEQTVRADALVQINVLTLTRQIERKASISAADLASQRVWISPTGSPPIRSVADAVGRIADSRLEAGTILREAHIEQPIAVERGERVTVHCISGGVALKVKARALADGRVGDLIEMQLEGKRSPFAARVSGRGVAVVSLDAVLSAESEVK